MIFGAHPDDYEIGMGGTIKKMAEQGHDVNLFLFSNPGNDNLRIKEAQQAADILGAEFEFMNIPSEEVKYSRDLINKFDELIDKHNPDEIYTHWVHDSHQDHRVLTECLITSTRKNTISLYMYSQTVPGGIVPYNFKAQVFVDITDQIDYKVKSIEAHITQIKKHGHGWVEGIISRDRLHGYQIKTKYCETFEVVRLLK